MIHVGIILNRRFNYSLETENDSHVKCWKSRIVVFRFGLRNFLIIIWLNLWILLTLYNDLILVLIIQAAKDATIWFQFTFFHICGSFESRSKRKIKIILRYEYLNELLVANWFCYLRIYLLSSWKEIKPINAIQEFLLKTVQKIPVKTAAREAKIQKLTIVFISYDQWMRSVYVSWWTLTKSQRKHEFVFILAIIESEILNGKILRS